MTAVPGRRVREPAAAQTEDGRVSTDRPGRPAALVPTLVLVAALVALVSSLGAPLVPTIARTDGVSLSTAQWLLTATLLTGALTTPVLGRLADGPRQREVVLTGLALVLAGCVLAAVGPNFAVLVAGRALQGLGLGLVPVTMAIARRQLPFDKAARAIATLSATSSIGVGLGYPLTGLIAQTFDFHVAFWFGAAISAGALVVAAVVVPNRSTGTGRPFDVTGAVALSLAVIGVSLLLSEGGSWGWTSGLSFGVLGASAVVLFLWVVHELRVNDPLVDLHQIRNRSVLTADVSGLLISMSMYLFMPVIIEFVQVPTATGYGFGASIAVAGLALLPLSIATFVASRFLPVYDRRFGTRTMIPLGSVIFAVSMAFFAFEHRALWEAFVAVGFAGFGLGFTYAAMPGFIVRAVPHSETGSATGFYGVLRSVGFSLGSAISAAVLLAYTHPGHVYPSAGGFEAALLIASGLCVATAAISYVLPGRSAARPGAGFPGPEAAPAPGGAPPS